MKKFLASRINFVEQSVIRKIFEKTPPNSINLGLGEIQFPTPQIFLEYGKEVLDEGYIRYTPNAGLLELRETIAKYYEDRISSANICVTNGAEEAVFASIFCYVNPGEEVMLANPTFVAYETIIKMAQGIPVYFDLNPDAGFRLDKNSFLDKLSSKTKMIILNNPSNPLGIGFSEEEIDFILDICKKKNIL
ncbi:MAG: aspartate aminotransferase, partial [Candidatus Cloacimonadota bacterium]